MMEAVPREEIRREAWNAFVDAHPRTWAWHRYDYLAAKALQRGIVDLSFGMKWQGSLLGIMPLSLDTNRHPLARLARLPLNTISSDCQPVVAWEESLILKAMMRHFIELGKEYRVSDALIFTEPLSYAPEFDMVNPLVKLGFESDDRIVSIIPLTGPVAAWTGFEKRLRNDITHAERNGVTTRLFTDGDIGPLSEMHEETHRRLRILHPKVKLPEYSHGYFREMITSVETLGVIAELHGYPVAISVFVLHRGGAHYLWGFSTQEGRRSLANAAIQWRAVQEMCQRGIRYYKPGEIHPTVWDPHGITRGHPGFKSALGGTPKTWYRGRMVLNPRMHLLREIRGIL